jgi:hypothetical protein
LNRISETANKKLIEELNVKLKEVIADNFEVRKTLVDKDEIINTYRQNFPFADIEISPGLKKRIMEVDNEQKVFVDNEGVLSSLRVESVQDKAEISRLESINLDLQTTNKNLSDKNESLQQVDLIIFIFFFFQLFFYFSIFTL